MPDNDRISITVSLTQADYARAIKAFVTRRATVVRLILFCVATLTFSVFFCFWLATSADYLVSGMISVGVVAIAMLFLIYGVPYFAARTFVKKNPDKLGPNRQEIGPGGASYQSQHGDARLAWSAFQQIRETPELFLFYTQSNFAQIVPKRCFTDQSEIEQYREIIRKYYAGKTELLSDN